MNLLIGAYDSDNEVVVKLVFTDTFHLSLALNKIIDKQILFFYEKKNK